MTTFCVLDKSGRWPRIWGRAGKARWFRSTATALDFASQVYGDTGPYQIANYEEWKYAEVISP